MIITFLIMTQMCQVWMLNMILSKHIALENGITIFSVGSISNEMSGNYGKTYTEKTHTGKVKDVKPNCSTKNTTFINTTKPEHAEIFQDETFSLHKD